MNADVNLLSLSPRAGAATRRLDISVYPATAKLGGRLEILRAFATSLSRTPHRVNWVADGTYRKSGLAIIYGAPGIGDGRRRKIRHEIVSAHRGPFLIVETPLLGRKVPKLRQSFLPFIRRGSGESFDRFRISLNGSFWDNGIFCNEPTDGARWKTLRQELGLEVRDYRKAGDHILLVGQVPGDASLRGLDVIKWMESTIIDLGVLSDRKVIIRPHPLTERATLSAMLRRLRSLGRTNCEIRTEGTLAEALVNAWATITYSSGAAIESLLLGVPALSLCPASMAWPVTDHELGKIEAPTLFDRRPWLDQIAHSQWGIGEVENGTVWERFEEKIQDLVIRQT